MTFAHPAILLLLWLVPVPPAVALFLRRKRLRRAALISSGARKRPSGLFVAQCVLLTAALAVMVIAAARPRWGQREQTIASSGRNVMILLDVSRSMLARDVRPDRLTRAKADLLDLIASLEGDRAGLIAFRNGARMICPFTTDRAFLAQALEGAAIDSAPRGETDIGSAITAALDAFKSLGSDHNAIILVSDGDDLAGVALEKAKIAAEQRIPIFCVGIGDPVAGGVIPDGNGGGTALKYRGEEIVSRLENATLEEIARISGGVYISLRTAAMGRNTLGDIHREYVRRVVTEEMTESGVTVAVERYQWFLIPGIVMALCAAALSAGRAAKRR
ncbi:MAG: VWA domain-containing protein, partial [Kiritimatiellaeota bacterium]|nr:VWA domain-containing protein [Kiritimatiellota bacterium]